MGSHSASAVTAAYTAGGLFADNRGMISLSYASGEVTAGSSRKSGEAGGLGGTNGGEIDQSFSTGAVQDSLLPNNEHSHYYTSNGGLVGMQDDGSTTNSYAAGAVTVNYRGRAGGLVGSGGGAISTSYALGRVSAPLSGKAWGFIGKDYSTTTDDYWDTDSSGVSVGCPRECTGVTGLTDAQLKSALPAGFDPKIWGQKKSINNGYPYLLANPPPR
jgi:hypothetical protein